MTFLQALHIIFATLNATIFIIILPGFAAKYFKLNKTIIFAYFANLIVWLIIEILSRS